MPLDNQPPLKDEFPVHPIVKQDSRIPPNMYAGLEGHHPGEFVRAKRIEEGYEDPADFVDAVNKVIHSHRVTVPFTLQDLEHYEAGTRQISNKHMNYMCEALNANVGEILYNIKPGHSTANGANASL